MFYKATGQKRHPVWASLDLKVSSTLVPALWNRLWCGSSAFLFSKQLGWSWDTWKKTLGLNPSKNCHPNLSPLSNCSSSGQFGRAIVPHWFQDAISWSLVNCVNYSQPLSRWIACFGAVRSSMQPVQSSVQLQQLKAGLQSST